MVSWFELSDLREDYQKSLKEYGESPKALLWWDYRSMAIRFKALVQDLQIEGKTIMDAGCGMGDLLPYLYAKSVNFRYLGVDKNPGFIEIAKKRYEGHNFKVGNPFDDHLGNFDMVLSSGVMNGNVKGWLEKRKRMIEALWSQTDEILAFNMAGGLKPLPHDSLIAYADANEILDFCKTLTKNTKLNSGYLHNDFTIMMARGQARG